MKKTALVLAGALCSLTLFSAPLSQAATFKDVNTSISKEVDFLTSKQVINGYQDGTFRPDEPLKRVHAVQLLVKALVGNEVVTKPAQDPGFTDVRPSSPGYAYIAKGVELGIISGVSKERFDPNSIMSRGQMAKVLTSAYQLDGIYPYNFSDVSQGYWAYSAISSLAANNITTGYSNRTFRPNDFITRGQFSVFLARLVQPSFKPATTKVKDTLVKSLLNVSPLDVVQDPKRPILYMMNGNTNSVLSYNYESGEKMETPIEPAGEIGERIAYANDKIYVVTHESGTPKEASVGIIDAPTMKWEKSFNIAYNPSDIAADDKGMVYITPKEYNDRYMSYNSLTGLSFSEYRYFYNDATVEMTADQSRLYFVSKDVSPRDLHAISLRNGEVVGARDSIYHGDYDLGATVALSPDGQYVFTETGLFFRTALSSEADMRYEGTLKQGYKAIAFDVNGNRLYTGTDNHIRLYDYTTMNPLSEKRSYGTVRFMFYNHEHVVILSNLKMDDKGKEFLGVEVLKTN